MPRARLFTETGGTTEWHSTTVARYQRRTRRVEEAILGVYLSGANGRRIRSALAPAVQHGPLSKDAVSRLVGRLKDEFEQWRQRDLAGEQFRYLFRDGWYPKVRLGKTRVVVAVLVVLGVRADRRKVLLDLRLAGKESTAASRDTIRSLVERHVGLPVLAVIDGGAGLRAALREAWPAVAVQRCTAPKARNLEASRRRRQAAARGAPRRLPPDDIRRDRNAGRGRAEAVRADADAAMPGGGRVPGGSRRQSVHLLRFSRAQWRALRTTVVSVNWWKSVMSPPAEKVS